MADSSYDVIDIATNQKRTIKLVELSAGVYAHAHAPSSETLAITGSPLKIQSPIPQRQDAVTADTYNAGEVLSGPNNILAVVPANAGKGIVLVYQLFDEGKKFTTLGDMTVVFTNTGTSFGTVGAAVNISAANFLAGYLGHIDIAVADWKAFGANIQVANKRLTGEGVLPFIAPAADTKIWATIVANATVVVAASSFITQKLYIQNAT